MSRYFAAALAALSLFGAPALGQTCGGTYVVKRGESLSLIANEQYDNASKWTEIHRNNIGLIGENPNSILAGMRLRLSCLGGLPTGLPDGTSQTAPVVTQAAAAAPAASGRALENTINIVTAGDYAPFTDPKLDEGGLMTELVNAAMSSAGTAKGYKVHWVNDWSSHLDPLMTSAMMDMAFPWFQPDCTASPDAFRCTNFHFSDPMFEMLILLFVDRARPVPFASDSDMHGRTLCRPAGYFTHDLDRADRRWLTDQRITLKQPTEVSDCFEMLLAGQVDAVAINEFTGRAALKSMGIKDRVEVVQGRPLSIEGLHVLVHKQHPQADTLVATINEGLSAIQASGRYQQVIDKHMSSIWADF